MDRNGDLSLVLAGGRGWGADEVDRAIAAATHGDRVISTGYVSDELVAVLMRRAEAVAYPAFEEGFGLPALEALACGTPLVTTKGSAMAEVAGGAAWLVAPGDVEALAEVIEEAVSGGSEVARRIAARSSRCLLTYLGGVGARTPRGLQVGFGIRWALTDR